MTQRASVFLMQCNIRQICILTSLTSTMLACLYLDNLLLKEKGILILVSLKQKKKVYALNILALFLCINVFIFMCITSDRMDGGV